MNSNPLSSWTPSIVAFAIPFVVTSVLSLLTYWLARRPGTAMRWVRLVFSAIASLATVVGLVTTFAFSAPFPVIVFVVVSTAASGLQAAIERAVEGDSLSFKTQYVRSLFTYLSTAFIAYWMAALVLFMAVTSNSTTSILAWDFAAIGLGFMAGVVIAPLSISFFRWVFHTLPMRPGIDRALHKEELAR